MSSILKKNNIQKTLLVVCAFMMLSSLNLSYAQDYNSGVGICKTLENIQSLLRGISVVVVTLAIMWAGYKFLFTRADIGECGKILAAGVMIGSAGTIASWFMTNTKCTDTVDATKQENYYVDATSTVINSALLEGKFSATKSYVI